MRPARRWSGTAGTLVLALAVVLGLSGCATDQERYCEEVAEQQEPLTEAFAADPREAFFLALPSFRALAAEAPRDIRDEWDTLIGAVEDLEEALDEAGVEPAAYDPEDLPAGLGAEDREAIEAAADRLASAEVAAALAGVEQQARDVCQTPLSL
jgi:hypothetical protein